MRKHTEKDLKKAVEAEQVARGRRMAIEEEIQEREFMPKRRALFGKCFKYRNNYSCPESSRDYWWMWMRVTGVRGICVVLTQVQRDKYGAVSIRSTDAHCQHGTLGERYLPVSETEYRKNVRAILKQAEQSALPE